MLRVLPFVLGLAISIYCLIDCVRTDDDEVRGLPKIVWVFVILLFPFAGGAGWLIAGRPRSILEAAPGGFGRLGGGSGTAGRPGPGRKAPPTGPDDDPDFLKGI